MSEKKDRAIIFLFHLDYRLWKNPNFQTANASYEGQSSSDRLTEKPWKISKQKNDLHEKIQKNRARRCSESLFIGG